MSNNNDSGESLSWRQRALVAVAPATRMTTGILMGTALAVYIGDRGTPFAVSMVATAYWLGLMVFAPVWGAIADITGRRRAVLVTTGLAATVAVLPLAVIDGVWIPIGFRALYAVFAAGFAPIMLSIVSAHGGIEARGRSIGFFNSAYAFGFAGGRFGAGVLLGLLLPSSLFLVVAAVSLASTVAVVFLADPTPDPDAGSRRRIPTPIRHSRNSPARSAPDSCRPSATASISGPTASDGSTSRLPSGT